MWKKGSAGGREDPLKDPKAGGTLGESPSCQCEMRGNILEMQPVVGQGPALSGHAGWGVGPNDLGMVLTCSWAEEKHCWESSPLPCFCEGKKVTRLLQMTRWRLGQEPKGNTHALPKGRWSTLMTHGPDCWVKDSTFLMSAVPRGFLTSRTSPFGVFCEVWCYTDANGLTHQAKTHLVPRWIGDRKPRTSKEKPLSPPQLLREPTSFVRLWLQLKVAPVVQPILNVSCLVRMYYQRGIHHHSCQVSSRSFLRQTPVSPQLSGLLLRCDFLFTQHMLPNSFKRQLSFMKVFFFF